MRTPSINLSPQKSQLFSDAAIRTFEEDELNRGVLAKTLAQFLYEHSAQESFVIGVQGPWGTGKSSVKNLCKQSLKHDFNHEHVIDFNPWQYINHEQLTQSFFDELIARLKVLKVNAEREIAAYSLFYRAGAPLLMSLMPLVFRLMSPDPHNAAEAAGIAAGASVAKGSLESIGSLLSGLEAFFKNEQQKRPFSVLRDEIEKKLAGLTKPIVVFMDDIDRLNSTEIKAVFQFVKTVANLPHVIYVLSYQRETVVSALTTSDYDGSSYLEKLVQFTFDLPTVEGPVLQRLIKTRLAKHFLSGDVSDEILPEWNELIDILRIDTVRKTNRLLNSAVFHKELLKMSDYLEVNELDLLMLEAIRVFEPNVYLEMYSRQQSVFCNPSYKYGFWKQFKNKPGGENDALEEILTLAKDRLFVRKAFSFLFPSLSDALNEGAKAKLVQTKSRADELEDELLSKFRIAHSLNFPRYFLLTLPVVDITQTEIVNLLKQCHHPEKFVSLMKQFEKRSVVSAVLERLHAQRRFIEETDLHSYARCLIRWAEYSKEYEQIEQMCFSACENIADANARIDALKMMIDDGENQITLYAFARRIVLRKEHFAFATKRKQVELVNCLLTRLRSLNVNSELWKKERSFLLLFWWYRLSKKEAKQFALRLMKKRNLFFRIAGALFEYGAPNYRKSAEHFDSGLAEFFSDGNFVREWCKIFPVLPLNFTRRLKPYDAATLEAIRRIHPKTIPTIRQRTRAK